MGQPTYRQKLLFDTGLWRFVVHKHAATRLHYDLRLEHAGVFKNWAVPCGPCLDPTRHRLAVLVKDHTIDCAGAEGIIPAGLYGAGTILLWDRGIWRTDQDVDWALRIGRLKFKLRGKKLKGSWSLTRMTSESSAKREKWLLSKENDTEAKSLSEMDILVEQPASVLSGRTLAEIARDPPPFVRGKSRRKKPPPNQPPLFLDDFEL